MNATQEILKAWEQSRDKFAKRRAPVYETPLDVEVDVGDDALSWARVRFEVNENGSVVGQIITGPLIVE